MEKGAFISYSHADKQIVEDLVRIIRDQLKFPLWNDNNLHGGDHYFSVIAEQILNYEFFIFVVSRHSVTSEFCTMELEFAKSEKKKIIAIWLEDLMPPPRVRMVISHTHYIRAFALTRDELQAQLKLALMENQLFADVTVDQDQSSDRYQEGDKYFLRAEEKQKIQYLLQLEQQGKYSACFEPHAAVLLGMAYELGIHTPIDKTQAEFYYCVAAHKGSADGEYLNLALQLEQENTELAPALVRMRELAEGDSLLAKVYFGDDLYKGKYGLRVDKQGAYRLWEMAARQHHPEAQYYMSFGYRGGEIGKTDYLLALMYAKEAQEAEFPRAYRTLGHMYSAGNFVKQDFEKAKAYYEKAVSLGDLLCISYLGNVEGDLGNDEKSFAYYQQAAELVDLGQINSGTPYYNLGYMYYYGEGTQEDKHTGVQLILKAARLGRPVAMRNAVEMILEGIPDRQEKCDLLKQASQCDCRGAEYYLGELFLSEDDPSMADYDQALHYYTLGAEKGNPNCMEAAIAFYGAFVGEEYTNPYRNRDKALSILRLLFALLDDDRDDMQKRMVDSLGLESCYYAYITELAVDQEKGKPDKKLALHYLEKALADDCVGYVGYYITMAVYSLNENHPYLSYDPQFADGMMTRLCGCLPRVVEKFAEEKNIGAVLNRFADGVEKMLQIYETNADAYIIQMPENLRLEKMEYYQAQLETIQKMKHSIVK